MSLGIGRSTESSTATRVAQIPKNDEPASFRYNNPGAQYPSADAARFGQLGYGVIGGGHQIARFPSPVNGAASNFDLLARKYVGMTIGAAGKKWTGSHGFGVPGYDSNALLTKSMVDDPSLAVAFLKAIAGRESGKGNNLTEAQWKEAHAMFRAGSADAYLDALPQRRDDDVKPGAKTGAGMLRRAREHIGEKYVNILVPKNDPNWKGPWDCAEFMSWLVYQEAGFLYGCTDNNADPATVEAYTGAWKSDLERSGKRVSVEEAAATVGGIVLRYPPGPGKMGHIAICDGRGGTVEAKGKRYGVVADTVHGRGWDAGILIPGISYDDAPPIRVEPPEAVYKPNAPNMSKAVVIRIQQALMAKGYDPNGVDGDYGPDTEAAVAAFQSAEGLVVDGAVGPETAGALGVSLLAPGVVAPDKPREPEPEIVVRDPTGPGPELGAMTPESLRLLLLAFLTLPKERSMADDPAKPGQSVDQLGLLLPLLLQSALSGKKLDTNEFLTVLLTGKPAVAPPPAAVAPPPAPAQTAQPDLAALLTQLIAARLIGPATKPDAPVNPAQPAMSRPSVQLGTAGLALTTILQALGFVGTPFGVGPTPTQTGTLATLVPLATTLLGATGGFGSVLSFGRTLLGGLGAATRPK